MHLYGGDNQEFYLGCINCTPEDPNSIWNVTGDYGNPANEQCIWNERGTFGGSFSNFSPFNEHGATPPIVRDRQGNFYGFFTIYTDLDKRATFQIAEAIYVNWREIEKDIPGWYTKIFGK